MYPQQDDGLISLFLGRWFRCWAQIAEEQKLGGKQFAHYARQAIALSVSPPRGDHPVCRLLTMLDEHDFLPRELVAHLRESADQIEKQGN